jgi:hypothetical protein
MPAGTLRRHHQHVQTDDVPNMYKQMFYLCIWVRLHELLVEEVGWPVAHRAAAIKH